MYNSKFFLLFFSVFLYSAFIYSQKSFIEKTDTIRHYKLSDIVITATKTPTNLLEIANSISVIDSVQISNSNAFNVFDLLRSESGISFTRQGSNGTLSNLYIRGSNSSHTLVLIDGVEMNLTNDPSGVYDFSALPIDNIERVEVLRGPQSTLYGSDALAGVINIITKKGSGAPRFSILTEGGSYNTYKGTLGLSGSFNRFNYSATISQSGSDGFSNASEKYGNTEKDGYTFYNASGLVGYKFNENAELNLFSRFTKSQSDYDQFGGPFGDDPTYVFDQEEFSVRGEIKNKFFDGAWNNKIGVSLIRNVRKYSFDTSSASIYSSRSLYDGRKYKLDWQNDFQLSSWNLLTAGVDIEFDEAFSEYYAFNSLLLPDYGSVIPFKSSRTIGVFLQEQINIDKSLFLTAGVRLDEHDKFGSQFTYRIAPAFMLWETNTKFKATIGTGFKVPSLYYLYDPSYGNENLSPEESFGFDAGVEQYFFNSGLTLGAVFFYNKFEDMFGFDYVTFKTININKAVTKGGEFFIQAKPIDNFEIKLNYTLTEARDLSPNSSNFDKKLLRRPANKTGLFTSYSFIGRANINAELIWVGTREDIDFSVFERTELKGYVLLNAAAHYDLFDFLRLDIRLENILDTDYEEVFGYGTPGFSVYGGIRLIID